MSTTQDGAAGPEGGDPRDGLWDALLGLTDPDVDPTAPEGLVSALAAVGRGSVEDAQLERLGRALAQAPEDEVASIVHELADLAPQSVYEAGHLALAVRGAERIARDHPSPPLARLAAALSAAVSEATARIAASAEPWSHGRLAEESTKELGELEPWKSILESELPAGPDEAPEVVAAWMAGMLSERHEEQLAARVRVTGPYRDAYRQVLAELAAEPVVVRATGPLAPETARTRTVLGLPHLGRPAALVVSELEGGETAWRWPQTEERVATAVQSEVEVGDDITGPLVVPVVHEQSSTGGDAGDLERAAEECVGLARHDPAAALPRALGLASVLRSFRGELSRISTAAEEGTASDEDEEIATSLLISRLALEETLAELPDNEALAGALLELDEALADVAEATLLVDAASYDDRLVDIVPLPGRWWSLRAELDEVLPDHLLHGLRETPVHDVELPSASAVREPGESYGAAHEIVELIRLRGPLRSDLALVAATGVSGTVAERSLPGGGTICLYRDADDALYVQVVEASAEGPYLLSWGSDEARQARIDLQHGTWEAGPIDESVLDAAELTLRSLTEGHR